MHLPASGPGSYGMSPGVTKAHLEPLDITIPGALTHSNFQVSVYASLCLRDFCSRSTDTHSACTQQVGSSKEWTTPRSALHQWLLIMGYDYTSSLTSQMGFPRISHGSRHHCGSCLDKAPFVGWTSFSIHLPVFPVATSLSQGQHLEAPKLRNMHHSWRYSQATGGCVAGPSFFHSQLRISSLLAIILAL